MTERKTNYKASYTEDLDCPLCVTRMKIQQNTYSIVQKCRNIRS